MQNVAVPSAPRRRRGPARAEGEMSDTDARLWHPWLRMNRELIERKCGRCFGVRRRLWTQPLGALREHFVSAARSTRFWPRRSRAGASPPERISCRTDGPRCARSSISSMRAATDLGMGRSARRRLRRGRTIRHNHAPMEGDGNDAKVGRRMQSRIHARDARPRRSGRTIRSAARRQRRSCYPL